jgi:hypothetical protein
VYVVEAVAKAVGIAQVRVFGVELDGCRFDNSPTAALSPPAVRARVPASRRCPARDNVPFAAFAVRMPAQ